MRAVLNVTGGFFSMHPLQRWTNLAGGLLLGIGMVLALTAPDPRTCIKMSGMLGLPGAFLIIAVPLSMGGMALRYVSTDTLLHLRPHGSLRMMLGATLAITLLAAIISLPILANYVFLTQFGRGDRLPPGLQPANWFFAAWSFTAATWLILFGASRSSVMSRVVPVLPGALLLLLGKRVDSIADLDASSVFAVMFTTWVAFALWHGRTSKVLRPMLAGNDSPLGFGNIMIGPLERLRPESGTESRARALRHYLLGSSSILAYTAAGTFPALLAVAMTSLMPVGGNSGLAPADFMYTLIFIPASLGFIMARRARNLWLRAGLDRIALYREAERTGIKAVLPTFLAGAIVLVLASIPGRQPLVPFMLVSTATLCILAVGLFYFGLSLTRGWNGPDVVLAIVFFGIGVFLLLEFRLSAIKPGHGPTITTVGITVGLAILFTLLLRWLASRRWRTLDWRVARITRMGKVRA